MIDHHEQHCRQILIDELEAVYPSLSVWASAEFDAGVSASKLRSVLFVVSPEAARLAERSADLANAVTFDDSGTLGKGGNGGLLSRETIHKAGLVQLTLNDIKKLKG
ncbi:hypothetical protein [Devosia sp. SL43]|uniref:hypothetical protein n=1 Tax=Devosia sp. SL43 TaxID=2806348 RepID=UPI001F39F1BA|nr:hypothetical protein [Devosia sp. SL43]UJW87927.1 hypothetical protein IM737_20815 [Devosia sp. SL43]